MRVKTPALFFKCMAQLSLLDYQLQEAPDALANIHMDNIAIVPASMLLQYDEVKRRAPRKSVVLVTPPMTRLIHGSDLQKVFVNVASYFRDKGRQVTTLRANSLAF